MKFTSIFFTASAGSIFTGKRKYKKNRNLREKRKVLVTNWKNRNLKQCNFCLFQFYAEQFGAKTLLFVQNELILQNMLIF